MNKYFLAGCAAAALVIGSGVASAQDFKVTISGEAKFQAMFVGQDKNAASRSVDFRNRFRLDVEPSATALGGALTYGAHLKMRGEGGNSGTVSFEDNRIFFSGAFGKVQLGDMGSWYDGNNVKRPADYQPEDGIAMDVTSASKDAAWSSTGGRLKTGQFMDFNAGGQNTKIRYDSPVISGFSFGGSYTPNNYSDAWDINRTEAIGTNLNDVFDVGVKFDSTDKSIADRFGGAVVKAAIGYGAGQAGPGYKNYSVVAGGVQVGYAGFTIGGGYATQGKSLRPDADTQKDDQRGWNVGATYVTGPWSVGVGYTDTQWDNNDAGAGKATSKVFSAGVKYNVAKGLDVALDYGHVSSKSTYVSAAYPTGVSDTANVVTLTAVVGF